MSAEAAVDDAWEREPTTGRHFVRAGAECIELPTDLRDRRVFCTCYGDKFDGDNHEEALRYAAFCVFYRKGMRLPPYDGE
jgi:hypothetical protein